MNMDTGDIVDEKRLQQLPVQQRQKYMPLTEEQLAIVSGMNRHERRKWAAEERRQRRARLKVPA